MLRYRDSDGTVMTSLPAYLVKTPSQDHLRRGPGGRTELSIGGWSAGACRTSRSFTPLIDFSGSTPRQVRWAWAAGGKPRIDTAYFDFRYGDGGRADHRFQYWKNTPAVPWAGRPCSA
jgi:hypothetical protein